jgi:hypothetical protein
MSKTTKEGRTAQKIIELVNDFTLDLEIMGMYIAQATSSVLYNRLYEVFDSARYHKERRYGIQNNPELAREEHYKEMERLGRD